jgi:TetR/AcrR family transcriptional repressor of lmrAB and yxaGH operons
MAQLLRDQGYTATGLAQVLKESGVSNGSLYHHFPGGMEELAEAALDASGEAVANALSQALNAAPSTGEGLIVFLDLAARPAVGGSYPGCPIAPTALESPALNPRLRATAARCFGRWEELIAIRLRNDGWTEDSIAERASAALALIEGALLLARVSGQRAPLAASRHAALELFGAPPQPRRS